AIDEACRSCHRNLLTPREAGGNLYLPLPFPARAHQPELGDAGVDDEDALQLAVTHDRLGGKGGPRPRATAQACPSDMARAEARGLGKIDLEERGSAGSVGRRLDRGEAPLEVMVEALDPDGHRVANREALPGGLWHLRFEAKRRGGLQDK